ncbi:MBL fold metallo-hydrolase [Coraliomargarita sp. SDUM461004]|uniref:MBL fold metallo-hydrolase n=1 Tax=Thalassobacterium sedimentorum TaxID=3041258 RepID=A0ABU1AJF7_9BACT|nr:MBL fold metallo-hydrolase [Coraliomargarita sp. SDUM461004]MDQ8194842.1 MBL fold metallo-hydrolase [Coraliomargarita sp. SDUM461004]
MSIEFQILGSSSGGNCALLQTGHSKVLVDVGFSAKRIGCMLEAIGESLDAIDAVFLTHEHSDHAQGIRGLARRAQLPVFANRDTADAVQAKASKPVNWQVFQTGTDFTFRDLKVRSFALPHDAYDPVGFTFRWGEAGDLFSPPRSLAWVTDLGYVPEHVKAHIRDVHTLVIEANYDEALLEQDERRPWSTKQRIRGRHGHLSNHASFELVEELSRQSTLEKVYLAHLSKDCNNVRLVREKFASLEKNLSIDVVDPESGITSANTALSI